MKVAVLGGGITGIAVARTLRARGYEPHVFEAEPVIGGLCRSETAGGFVHDLSGGHILHSRDAGVLARMASWLGPDGAVPNLRNTKIFYRGRYVKYPFENGLADLPLEDNYQCIKGYIDASIARQGGAPEPASFRDWIGWRMGAGIAECFMYPYNEKLWCSDLNDVSTSWVKGRVPEAPIDDVLRSALGISTEGYTHQIRFFYPRSGGFGTLVERLADGVRDCVRLSTPVRELAVAAGGRFEVNGEAFDAAINSIPLQELFRCLVPPPPADVLAAVRALKFLSIATVLVGVARPHLSDHSWVYLPHPENGPSNRITYLMNYSPENAPPGHSSILAEVTFPGDAGPRIGPELEKEVVASLERNGMLHADEVVLARSAGFRYAYPYYDVDFEAKMTPIRAWLQAAGLHTLGRFGAYKYVNTDQVMMLVDEFFGANFPALVA